MRVRRESLLLLGVLTAVCALAGIIAGIATGALVESPQTPPPTHALEAIQPAARPTIPPTPVLVTPSAPGQQWSLLIIGVDDLASPHPRLEGCWVLTYRTGDFNYYGIRFPLGAHYAVPGLIGDRTLPEVFEIDWQQQRGFTFLRDAIHSRYRAYSFDADLVLDRGDFAGLVAEVGYLALAGQAHSGEQLLAAYDSSPTVDEIGRLSFQQQVFQSLFEALRDQGWTPAQVAAYLQQLPQLRNDSARAAALDAYAAEAPPFAEAVLNWTDLPP